MAGLFPKRSGRPRQPTSWSAIFRQAAAKAAEHGLTILLEPLNQRDMPGYFYSRVEEAVAIIDRVGAPNVKLMFDAYHVGA